MTKKQQVAKVPVLEMPKKAIASYTDSNQLRQIMLNAKRQKNMEVYWHAFRRLCELEGKNYEDPLERDFYATLAAYEELLAEKNGRRTSATRTRQKLHSKGFVACLEDWAVNNNRTDGFDVLVRSGHIELTGEYLVTKYPDRFSPKAVENAQMVLDLIKNVPASPE